MFLRKTKPREPLPITMSGVRMGERLLQVGVGDPPFVAALAAKVGMSGAAAIAVPDADSGARATAAAARAGALVDVTTTSSETLPYGDASFDVVIAHATRAGFGVSHGTTAGGLRELLRVLRHGGRLVAVTATPRSGLGGLLRSTVVPSDGEAVAAALTAAGFRPVRIVGELEGLRFIEGMKA